MLPALPSLLACALALVLTTPAKGEILEFAAPASAKAHAFPAGNGHLGTLVSGKTDSELLPLFGDPRSQEVDPKDPGAGFSGDSLGGFRLDWLDTGTDASDYRRTLDLHDGLAVTKFKRGKAGFTFTTFVSAADDLMVVHLRTNLPGSLSFRVKLEQGETRARVEDRRTLILDGRTAGDMPFQVRAWVFPMESDVTPGKNEITVRGEGEALILVAAACGPEQVAKLPGRMKAHGFGAGEHPDIFRLWSGLLERHRVAHRKAMGEKSGDFARYLKVACGR